MNGSRNSVIDFPQFNSRHSGIKFIASIKSFITLNNLVVMLLGLYIFGSWMIAQCYVTEYGLYGSVVDVSSAFKSSYSWLPLVRAVAHGNLFPSLATINPTQAGLQIYPYVTLWAYSFSLSVLGLQATFFMYQFCIPLICYFLTYAIFKRHLSSLWSLALASLALVSFTSMPFRGYLLGLLGGKGWIELGSLQSPEILLSPIPSFSTLCFLSLFYLSTPFIKLSFRRVLTLSVLWALFVQVHAVDAVFGLSFWVSYSLLRMGRQKESMHYLVSILSLELGLALAFAFPTLVAAYLSHSSGIHVATLSNFQSNVTTEVTLYFYAAYYLIPLALMFILLCIQRIDPYELIIKFWHVYVLMLIEILLVYLASHAWLGLSQSVLENRITFLFLHLYYYVPVIYFASRHYREYNESMDENRIGLVAKKIISFTFSTFPRFYLPIFIALLLAFSTSSVFSYIAFHQDVANIQLNKALAQYDLSKNYLDKGEVLVSTDAAVNMLATIDLHASVPTLWVNRFSNEISEDESIDRLALYAKLCGWNVDKFTEFMMPGQLQAGSGHLVSLLDQEVSHSGVGYWLVNHETVKTSAELQNYSRFIRQRYSKLDVVTLSRKFGVRRVFDINQSGMLHWFVPKD